MMDDMSEAVGPRVFVTAEVLTNTEGLEKASADDTFYVVGPELRYEIKGYVVPVGDLETRGIPRQIAREVSMIASLRTSEHMILFLHEGRVWELLVLSKPGLPDTYTFKE